MRKEKLNKRIERPRKKEEEFSALDNVIITETALIAAGKIRQYIQDFIHKSPTPEDILNFLQKDESGEHKKEIIAIFKEQIQNVLKKKAGNDVSKIEALKRSFQQKITDDFGYLKDIINFDDII